jgi:hypothetical protein
MACTPHNVFWNACYTHLALLPCFTRLIAYLCSLCFLYCLLLPIPVAVIVFVGYDDIALKVLEAAALHPVLGSEQVLWVGLDAWTGLLLHSVPIGTIGITPQVADTPVTSEYLDRWVALDPVLYPSLNGEGGSEGREVLASYSATVVDAILALAFTLQNTIDKRIGH